MADILKQILKDKEQGMTLEQAKELYPKIKEEVLKQIYSQEIEQKGSFQGVFEGLTNLKNAIFGLKEEIRKIEIEPKVTVKPPDISFKADIPKAEVEIKIPPIKVPQPKVIVKAPNITVKPPEVRVETAPIDVSEIVKAIKEIPNAEEIAIANRKIREAIPVVLTDREGKYFYNALGMVGGGGGGPDTVGIKGTVSTIAKNYATQTQVDSVNANVTYIGKATIGSATSAAVWQIQKLDETSGADVTWADGNDNFDNIWDNRESLSYS